MSRVLLVALDEGQVVAACLAEKVGISTIERLSSGGIRLVCNSMDGRSAHGPQVRGAPDRRCGHTGEAAADYSPLVAESALAVATGRVCLWDHVPTESLVPTTFGRSWLPGTSGRSATGNGGSSFVWRRHLNCGPDFPDLILCSLSL